MKKDIKVISKKEIYVNGELFQLKEKTSEAEIVGGTSSRGLWNLVTNGKINIRIYKADLSKEAGKILFN